jgi:hypothetical protein
VTLITADALVCHAIGDYILQSDWMANEKTKRSIAALAHVLVYTILFLILTRSWEALAFIAATHFIIDRWRLARYVCWAKNFLQPGFKNHPWSECSITGYHQDRPTWMGTWLLIIADNTFHVICNGIALKYLI